MGAKGYQKHMPLITTVTILLAPIILAALNNGTVEPSGHGAAPALEYRPIDEVQYRVFAPSDGRRRLTPFQLCLACRCCSGGSTDPSLCTTLPCCFGIDCSLPDKPYGVCAFVPKTCNCTACGIRFLFLGPVTSDAGKSKRGRIRLKISKRLKRRQRNRAEIGKHDACLRW
ncbi:unnamed protein product [Victoria cruziana]